MTKPKYKSRILGAVHEMASDLYRLGFVDKRKMQKYDDLCLALRTEIAAGRTSGTAKPAKHVFARLDAKYRAAAKARRLRSRTVKR